MFERDPRKARFRMPLLAMLTIASPNRPATAAELLLAPASMPRVGTVDQRFQSYNIEMVEVTGGDFWRPYGKASPAQSPPGKAAGEKPKGGADLYAYRPPIDFNNPRLRHFAAALSPVYLRVSGTWANATYFAGNDDASEKPPPGFNGVLTHDRWQDVMAFSQVVGALLVTSFAVSAGTHDGGGRWTSEMAARLLSFTQSRGGRIAAAEFMNEPNLAAGAPAGYDAAGFRRDFGLFRTFLRQAAPDTLILGPGTIGTDARAAELFAASADGIDALSYHHYGDVSARCGGHRAPATALSELWLAQADRTLAFYRKLRDRLAPDKPIWLTETAETACGGNRWAATFLDTFRYLDQLGRLAKAGVQVVMHNTLAASDYGLLDEETLLPRPNYWGALLWRRLMGTTVLDAGVRIQSGLHVYAHCQRASPGGVTLLVINNDLDAGHELRVPNDSTRYTLDAAEPGWLQTAAIRLNGRMLEPVGGDQLPDLQGAPQAAGSISFAAGTITFLTVPGAANSACR
jgi:hypothetical protein